MGLLSCRRACIADIDLATSHIEMIVVNRQDPEKAADRFELSSLPDSALIAEERTDNIRAKIWATSSV